MVFTPEGIVMSVRLLQSIKASYAMFVTPLPIVTLISLRHL